MYWSLCDWQTAPLASRRLLIMNLNRMYYYSALHKSLQSPPFFACLYLYAACLLRLRICQMCHDQPSRLSGMNRFVSYLRWLGLSLRCSKTIFIGLLRLRGISSGISEVRPGTYLVQEADRAVTPLSLTSLMVAETAPNQVGYIQAQTSVKLVQIVKIYAKHCMQSTVRT